jgi:hypothetical protein
VGSGDLQRLAEAAESLERQAGQLRGEIQRLVEAEHDRAVAEPSSDDSSSVVADDSEARLVAYSMVLDGRPREEVARHLAEELGLTDSDALLDDLYARTAG